MLHTSILVDVLVNSFLAMCEEAWEFDHTVVVWARLLWLWPDVRELLVGSTCTATDAGSNRCMDAGLAGATARGCGLSCMASCMVMHGRSRAPLVSAGPHVYGQSTGVCPFLQAAEDGPGATYGDCVRHV